MENQRTILWDVDGVLADFCYGFTKEAGLTPWSHNQQQAWDFDEYTFPKHLQTETWKRVVETDRWWEDLPGLLTVEESRAVEELHDREDLQHVFCTNREGKPNAQQQTRHWLWDNLWLDTPSVVLSKRKGDVAKAIGATYAIDDKAENCACIHWISDSPQTKVYVLDRPYNRVPLPKRIRRVQSVAEFIADVKAGK